MQLCDEQISELINYCLPHHEKMWAAKVLGIVFDCDFRDSKEAAEKWIVSHPGSSFPETDR